MKKIVVLFCLFILAFVSLAQETGFQIIERKENKQIDILWNGKLMTAYCYYDSIRKPFLYPLNTVDGITVTRGFPINPRPGERTDHPHHTGMWMNYESVNGLDFWNNSTAIAIEKRDHYGTIVHTMIANSKAGENSATITAFADWVRPDKKVLIKEASTYYFFVSENSFIIERTTSLVAIDSPVVFRDVKDGMFAIRVARELELPSKEASKFVDDKGNVTNVPPSGNEVTGMYYGSTGLKGDSVWGSKGNWMMLTGKKEGKNIAIGIFDHPSNPGYPAYWHARGYGLFAVNPLGRKIFSNAKEELNFTLQPNQPVDFRYRVLIHTGPVPTADDMNRLADDFGKVK
jgi:hypothetical protein